MAQTQIELSDTQMAALERLAQARNISVAGLIQESIHDLIQCADRSPYTPEQKQRALHIIGRFNSGLGDLAKNHDVYFLETLNS